MVFPIHVVLRSGAEIGRQIYSFIQNRKCTIPYRCLNTERSNGNKHRTFSPTLGTRGFFSRTTRSFAADMSCFVPKYFGNLWSTGTRSPRTHYILRYTHNTGASIIANRKKENLPPLGYCLCLQSTPFSAFSSLFGRQPEIRLRSHVNRKWSFCMFACGGGGCGATSHTFSYVKSKRCSHNLQSNQQGSCQRTDRLHKEPTLLFVNCKWKLNNI